MAKETHGDQPYASARTLLYE